MKLKFKQQLLTALVASGWQQNATEEDCDEWFLAEIWRIQSVRENWGQTLLILFCVDPQWEGGEKSQGVTDIVASTERPTHFSRVPGQVAELSLYRANFEGMLKQFIAQVNDFRTREVRRE